MTTLALAFAAAQALSVQLVAPAPTLDLQFQPAQVLAARVAALEPTIALQFQPTAQLAVAVVTDIPQLTLRFHAPTALDASLVPVLIGPPGPPGGTEAAPVSRSLSWSAGQLVGVAYADGRSKAFAWSGEQLTRVDRITPGQPTQRADLSYNPDGTLAAIAQSVI